ncbi:MAG TPA: peptidase T [Limnochordia bacterium]
MITKNDREAKETAVPDGPPAAPAREVLLQEGVAAKLIRYAQIDTTSDDRAAGVPSTPGQWELARLLAAELEALGLADVDVDQHAIVTATLPGTVPGAPTVGLLAHLDTVPGVPGRGVRPIVHRRYSGGAIELPAGPVLRPEEYPALRRVVGHDLITSDGSTLLGADDKAGIAVIMEALARLIKDDGRPRCDLRIGFLPDEEIGRGPDKFDTARFGARCAYTLDGGELGELVYENFNALNCTVILKGVSAHTGTARGAMINAVHLAATLIGMIPASMRPETTLGKEGFIHPQKIAGDVETIELSLLLRDFTEAGLAAKRALLERWLGALEAAHPGCEARYAVSGSYRNMRPKLDEDPLVVERVREAMRRADIAPIERPIRGGTDGAKLTWMGLPTPNLFTGAMAAHSRVEWVSVQWMEKAVEMIGYLAELWASDAH